MPKWYRLNTGGNWAPLKVYRLNTSGTWAPMKKIYRLYTSGNWNLVHTTQDVPAATTSPTLINQNSSTTNFYGGDTLTLTRGAYTNTTANSDTTYRMRIYKGTNASLALNATNWIVAAEANYTGANSTSSTSLTYSLTDADAKAGYYLVGEVRLNNDANTVGSSDYDFETASRVLSRISFSVTNLTVSPTSYGGGFSWTVSGVADSTFIYDQTLVIRLLNSTGTIKKVVSIAAGTTSTTVSDSTNLSPLTTYYAEIQVTANDGWKTSATPNKLTSNTTFNTLSAPPVNTVAPTISPLNGRTPPSGYLGYLPVSTTLTSTTGTWTNLSSPTYTYNWYKEDSITGSLTSSLNAGSQLSYSVSDVDDFIFVQVRATNSDGSLGTANSGTYILHQAVAVGNVTPTTATQNVSTNFSFNISHYPTSYVVNWGDGTSNSYTVAANTSTVNQTIAKTYTTTGTKTITITAQPGNKTSTTNITVSAPAPSASGFSRSDATTTPSQPSTLSFSSSNNQVTTSWTNGSPVTSVNFAASGAGVNTNYTDTSSPFITSDVSNYSSSGTYSATVTNYNNDLYVNVSWNQSNSQSYRVDYTSSVYGGDVALGNSSAGSVSVNIPFSGGGTFTWTSLTLYTGLNQTGTSTQYSNPVAGGLVPTTKSSSRTGSTSLTYTSPNLTPPTITSVSQTTPGGSLAVFFSGGSGPRYQIWWQSSSDYSGVTSYDANGSSSPVTDTTGPSAGTWYVAVRSVSALTNTGSGPSSTISAWSSPVQFTVSQATYTVTWNANGGTVSPTSSTVNQGASVTAPTPTRSGYEFVRWTDTMSGDYTYTVLAGGSFTPPYSITMYARWTLAGSAPATPTGVSTSGSGLVTWNASSGATSYTVEYYLAQDSSGLNAYGPLYGYPGNTTSYQIAYGTYNGNYLNYARARVSATNSSGTSAYSSFSPVTGYV